jgi:DNA invertase Pin-like site-specific DNA recombinase
MPEAVGYIRRSVSRTNDAGDLSREFQSDEVQRLAGEPIRIIDADWGRSAATDKTFRRLAFLRLMESVERGEVSTLFAYSADRLARSIEWSARLWSACKRSRTAIVTTSRRFEPYADDDAGWAIWHYEAVANEQALNSMSRKARDTAARRKDRGDDLGAIPYGKMAVKVDGVVKYVDDPDRPVEPILEAVRQANGRIRTAVRIINKQDIPTARGKKWDRSTLLRLVEREAPEIRPMKAPSGRRDAPATPALFAKLLRCHCGATMTPNRHVERRRKRDSMAVSYYCHRGNADRSDHRRVYIAESRLRAVIEAESARLRFDFDAVQLAEDDGARVAQLEERKRKLTRAYTADSSTMTDAEYDAAMADIRQEREALADRGRAVEVPQEIDWTAPVERVNDVLRALWERVELGPDLMPVQFVWRVSEWRR